jgi:hypothetical protein
MADLHEFSDWYDVYLEAKLPPAAENPNYVPGNNIFGNMIKGVINIYDKVRGRDPRDWQTAQDQNVLARQQRDYEAQAGMRNQQAQLAAGNPDDPTVRAQKAKYLVKPIFDALMRSLTGVKPSKPDVTKAFKYIASQMSEMFCGVMPQGQNMASPPGTKGNLANQGRPVTADPIFRAMPLVHSDPMIPDKVKQVAWATPLHVLNNIITPVVKATPQAWYNPNAVWPKGALPPGTMIDFDDFERASRQWHQMGSGNKRFDQSGIEAELKKNRVKPGTLAAADLESLIGDIYNDLKAQGHDMTGFGPTERKALITAYARPATSKPSSDITALLDRYLIAHAGSSKGITDAATLDKAIDDIQSMATADGTNLVIDPKKVLAWARGRGIT